MKLWNLFPLRPDISCFTLWGVKGPFANPSGALHPNTKGPSLHLSGHLSRTKTLAPATSWPALQPLSKQTPPSASLAAPGNLISLCFWFSADRFCHHFRGRLKKRDKTKIHKIQKLIKNIRPFVPKRPFAHMCKVITNKHFHVSIRCCVEPN